MRVRLVLPLAHDHLLVRLHVQSSPHASLPLSLHSPPVHVARLAQNAAAAIARSHLHHLLVLRQLHRRRRRVDRVGIQAQTLAVAQLRIVIATPGEHRVVLVQQHARRVARRNVHNLATQRGKVCLLRRQFIPAAQRCQGALRINAAK